MRAMAFALAVALALVLPGCLEDPALEARVDEARQRGDALQGDLLNATAEARGWRDAAQAQANETAAAAAERDEMGRRHAEADAQRAAAEAERDLRVAQLEGALADLEAARVNVTALQARLAVDVTTESLARELEGAKQRLARAQERYDAALADRFETMISVEKGNVTWQWTDLRGSTQQWRWPMEEYRKDVKRVRPGEYVTFSTVSGRHIRVADPRPYLDEAPFEVHVRNLTDGRTDREFVREAFRMKTQLVDYQFQLLDERGFYKYPGETLVEGTGICGDTTILLASVLAAGSAQAGYGIELALWIVDLDVFTGATVKDPDTVDHALLEVKFRDGTVWYVETTAYAFTLHPQVHGWRYAWA